MVSPTQPIPTPEIPTVPDPNVTKATEPIPDDSGPTDDEDE